MNAVTVYKNMRSKSRLPKQSVVGEVVGDSPTQSQRLTRLLYRLLGRSLSARAQVSGSGVFSINFVREEHIPLSVRRGFVYGLFFYVALNVFALIMLLTAAIGAQKELGQIKTQLVAHAPSANIAGVLQEDMATLHQRGAESIARLNEIIQSQHQRLPVAGKLAALTKTLPVRTWITDLSGDHKSRKIEISASFFIDPDNPYYLPTKSWMDALRADPAFGKDLKQLELSGSANKTQGETDLINFSISAEWKEQGK